MIDDITPAQFDIIASRLKLHEGLRLKPYRCTMGKLTIGIGRNLEDTPLTDEEKRACGDYMHGITENSAKMLLRNDIVRVLKECKEKFTFWKELDFERKYALIDMVFQLGVAGVKKFRKMNKAIKEKNYVLASQECLNSAYAQQTPKRAKRIAKLWETGVWLA